MKRYNESLSVKFSKAQIEAIERAAKLNYLTKTEYIRSWVNATKQHTAKYNDLEPLVSELNELIKGNESYKNNKSIAKKLDRLNQLLVHNMEHGVCDNDSSIICEKINIPITSKQKEKLEKKSKDRKMSKSQYVREKIFKNRKLILKKALLPILEGLNASIKKSNDNYFNSKERKVIRKIWKLF